MAILAVLLWPSADPADAVPPEPTPDVDAMIQQALAAAVTPTPEPTPTLTPTPTLQPPNLLPITVSGYTEYRFLHFLAEYRNCFGGELLANVDPALEPTPELLLLEPTPIPEAGGEPTPNPDADTGAGVAVRSADRDRNPAEPARRRQRAPGQL